MIIVSALISLYYNVIIAVCIYYFFASMRSTLLWTSCDPEWASCLCRDSTMNKSDPDPWNSTRMDCCKFYLSLNNCLIQMLYHVTVKVCSCDCIKCMHSYCRICLNNTYNDYKFAISLTLARPYTLFKQV